MAGILDSFLMSGLPGQSGPDWGGLLDYLKNDLYRTSGGEAAPLGGAKQPEPPGYIPSPITNPGGSLPAWASQFGTLGQVPGAEPQPQLQTMPVGLNTRGAPLSLSPQNIAPGVSALPTEPQEGGQPGLAALLGFLNSGSILGGVGAAIGGATTGQRTDPAYLLQQQQQNQVKTARAVEQALLGRGEHTPAEARALGQAVAGDKEVAKALLPQIFGQQKPAGNVVVAGMTIPFYRKPSGEMQFVIPGMGGPQGMQALFDFAHKQEELKAAATERGKIQTEAQIDLPQAQSNLADMLKEVQQIKTHPGLSLSTGIGAGHLPAGALGADQADFVKRVEQLKGALSQAGIQSMRGSGLRITQQEANWFGAALGRLDRTVGEKNYITALTDIENKLRTVYQNNQTKAGVKNPSPAPTFAPGGWSGFEVVQ